MPVRLDRASAAYALPAGAALVLAGTVVAELHVRPGLGPGFAGDPSWIFGLTAVVYCAAASAMLRRGAVPRLAWGMTAVGLLWAVSAVLHVAVRSPLFSDMLADGVDGGEAVVLWLLDLTSVTLTGCCYLIVMAFPTGRWLRGAWWWVTAVGVSIVVGVAVLLVLLALPISVSPDPAKADPVVRKLDPTSLPWLGPSLEPYADALIGVAYVGAVLCGAALVVRYRRSAGLERDQMRWLFWGALVVFLVTAAFRLFIDPGQLNVLGILIALNVLAIAMGIAVVDPTRVSIEDLLSNTAVFGGLSVVIVLVDLAALRLLTAVLGERLGESEVVLAVLLLSAALYNPVRARLWALVRRVVLGERDNPYDVVAGLATSLESVDEGHGQLAAVATAVATAFRIPYVGVEISRPGGRWLVASHGSRPHHVRTLPITYRDEEVGHLVLPKRGVRNRLSVRDQRLLGDLVRQAATAARTSLMAEELQRNRQRLVVAREAERRRIRDELHEDLGPTVSGLVHQVEAARLLVADRPEEAKAKIEATSAQLRAVVADVRRVVHDLRPPALDDLGLLGALRQQAERAGMDGLAVTVWDDKVESLPAAIEVAAFRIAEEALRNVVTHARAARCEIRLSREVSELVVEVSDDGIGIDGAVSSGRGLATLRARATELGGTVEVLRPATGGTVVRARLPLRGHP